MIRFFLRLLGLICLAGALATFVVDGTRSIAASALLMTPIRLLAGTHVPALETAVLGWGHPLVWDPGLVTLLRFPLVLLLTGLGLGLVTLARRRRPPVGESTR